MLSELKIVIPKEDFAIVASPVSTEALRQRLSKVPEPKSPEALAHSEERAKLLHEAHIEAVAARAKRENERVAEAKRRAAHLSVASAKATEMALEEKLRRSVAIRDMNADKRRAFAERRAAFAEGLRERRAAMGRPKPHSRRWRRSSSRRRRVGAQRRSR